MSSVSYSLDLRNIITCSYVSYSLKLRKAIASSYVSYTYSPRKLYGLSASADKVQLLEQLGNFDVIMSAGGSLVSAAPDKRRYDTE